MNPSGCNQEMKLKSVATGRAFLAVADPDGNRLEFYETPPRREDTA